jgi:hypothetical protein
MHAAAPAAGEKRPNPHGVHVAAPDDEDVPGGQTWHDGEPADEKVPGSQVSHRVAAMPEKRPAAHNVQFAEPSTEAKVPDKQGAQLVEPRLAAKFPGAHTRHVAEAGTDANWPTAHSVHEPAPAPLNRPTGQSMQVVLAVTGAAVPAKQRLQPSPATEPALPIAQLVQVLAPASEEVPGGHSRQLVAPVVPAKRLEPQTVHGALPLTEDVPSWHSPAGTPVGPLVSPVKVTSQPTSIVPLLISRSHAFAVPWPGTPRASTAGVAVVSMVLFHPTVFVNVASEKTNDDVTVRLLRSVNGTRNSTQSDAAEIATCEPEMAYQVPPANHSISGLFEPATCMASCRLGLRPSRTPSPLSSPRNACPFT